MNRPGTAPVLISVAPNDQATPRGAIFGGWIMAQLDHAAGLAGRKIAAGDALVLSVEELLFRAPLRPGEEFAVHADLIRRGGSSFNLSLSGWAEPDAACRLIFEANVLMVAVDVEGKSRKLP